MFHVHKATVASVLVLAAGAAVGQSHEALVLVNPNNAESLHVSNYYSKARDIPISGLAYFDPATTLYADFANSRVPALMGTMANSRNRDSIDYVILTSDTPFRLSAPGYVTDQCAVANRFSLSACYTMAQYTDTVLGGTTSLLSNGFFDVDGVAKGFDSNISYHSGEPGVGTPAGRAFIGAALGHTGDQGTDRQAVLDMIDRSVAADGTFPSGTFHFLQTNDAARSGPRHGLYTAVVNKINAAGGNAVRTVGPLLPSGGVVSAGAMSGFADADIAGADFTFANGAFADHLTSFGATFTVASQTKIPRWIEKGAICTFGTIQEPCNYPNKFPTPYLHSMYYEGATVGEACFRSLQAVPFQGMLLGDPLCHPYTHVPSVGPGNLPTGTVSGNVSFVPTASTAHPSAAINLVRVYIDGILRSEANAGNVQFVRTTFLDDGWHEIRIVAVDNTEVGAQGEWVGDLYTNNNGKIIGATPPATNIDRSGLIQIATDANDPNVTETRLLHNNRVVAAIAGSGNIETRGEIVGVGPVRVRVEMDFADGTTARSQPFEVEVDNSNPPTGGGAPMAYDFTKTVVPGEAYVLEMPAMHNTTVDEPTFSITSGPSQGTVLGGNGRFRIIEADAGAAGTDQVTYSVTSDGQTDTGVATIVFFDPDAQPCPADTNLDGVLNGQDFSFWVFAYNSNLVSIADINMDGMLSPSDFSAWVGAYNLGCDF